MAQQFIDIQPIEDAWKADVATNLQSSLGLKTIDSYEKDFDDEALHSRILLPPFFLFQYVNGEPIEKFGDRSTLKQEEKFMVFCGAATLLSRRAQQTGCYGLLSAIKKQYDGYVLQVPSAGQISLAWEGHRFVKSMPGFMVYVSAFSFVQ